MPGDKSTPIRPELFESSDAILAGQTVVVHDVRRLTLVVGRESSPDA